CHWCHVMERESFESEAVAEVLNRLFIPVKVDREERPDVDRIYMAYVQASTGSGGWPMSVWLTPDLKPFHGGTYFPPDNRYGRPGFVTILEYISRAWNNERAKVEESSAEVMRQLESIMSTKAPGARLDEQVLHSCFNAMRRSFDSRLGGFGGAPKFPRPAQLYFLHRYYKRTRSEEALEMSLLTLREMAKGGMYDQLGGGFHRYSVDARWFVPHFEKMLYDQGQLVVSYLEAFQLTGDEEFARVARETLDYVLRDMVDPVGAFHSAEDADSVLDPADPHEKGEGAFYIWTQHELEEILGKPHSDWFCHRFGVEVDGNVAEDPHHEFTGRNILYQAHTIAATARQFGVTEADVASALAVASRKLMDRRADRVRPHLDDKVLTAWNGLMISAFAKAAQVLGDAKYLDAAQKAAGFVLARMYSVETGRLLRRYRDGDAAIDGFQDDYALFVQALLDLYEASFDASLLQTADRLTRTMIELFEDREIGGFFSTTDGDASLVLRMKDDYDGAEPAGNSVAALNLLRLARITGDQVFHAAAERTLKALAGRLQAQPVAAPFLAAAYQYSLAPPIQIVIAGESGAQELLAEVRKRFLPDAVVLKAGEWLPSLRAMQPIDGKAAAYVCENFTCRLPVTTVAELAALLE
ncbi:MAG: thioredoxin domain-containing protein, partial [Candidatus Solibacter usitatus]|nr:thioredoxin domain-containing protein [Candidatus Solibacter usitatus]